jgi:SH3 domain protein
MCPRHCNPDLDIHYFMTMKAAIPLFLSLLLSVIPAHAATMYVTDEIPVMVRQKPGANRKIVAMPNTGTRLEVLENKEDGWSKVRLPSGKEGWTLTRYLTKGPSKQVIIDRLQRENKALRGKSKTLIEENPRLKTERTELQKALSEQTRTAEDLKQSYETLKRESSKFLALKASYEKASHDLAESTKRQAELEEEVKALRNNKILRWFLAGAAVLLVGMIIGFITRRPKRRPTLL